MKWQRIPLKSHQYQPASGRDCRSRQHWTTQGPFKFLSSMWGKPCSPEVTHRSPHWGAASPAWFQPGLGAGRSLQACTGLLEQSALQERGVHSKSKGCLRDVALSKTGRNQGLRGAGRSACARTWSFLELNVPGTRKGSKQRSRSCLCLCSPGQPRPGLDKTSSTQARRACLHH